MFKSLMTSLEADGPITENDVALLLHICSFGPFDSSSSDRLQFADMVWNKVNESNLNPTSKLYNMKLKVYCANDKNFTPVEELSTMKSLGINPDKITYGFLIEGFCQNGDIAGANHVLEAMSDSQLFIGVSIFNSFITGHLKAGSSEEASKVFETLRSRGLSPNSDTYYRFIHHYAKEGDVESVLKYISEAEKEELSLDQTLLMKVYRTMLINGQKDETKRILPILTEKDVFRNTSMQNLCQLVAEGFHDEALHLYLNIPKGVTETVPVTTGAFLLKCMIINDQDANDVIDVADRLLDANPSAIPHRFALIYAYKMNKPDIAVKLLEAMIERKQEIKIPMIIPAICHYRDSRNVEGIYKMTDMLLSLEPCEELVELMDWFCLPALKTVKQNEADIIAKMEKHETKWNTFFFLMDLKKKNCDVAFQNMQGKSLDNTMVSWIDQNRHLLTRDLPAQKESCVNIITQLIKKNSLSKLVAMSVLMNRLSANDLDTVHFMLDGFKKEKIRIPDRCLKYRNVIEAPQDVQNRIKELCEYQRFESKPGFLTMADLRKKTKEELEVYLKNNPGQIIARVALLNQALTEMDLPDIQKRLREIETMEFSFPKFQLVRIITGLTDLGDVESALHYFNKLRESCGTSYPDTIPLTIAVKQVEQGNIEGALDMIHAASEGEYNRVPGKEYVRNSKISNVIGATKTMEAAEAVHKALVQGKSYLVTEDAGVAHYNYIKKALDCDDDKTLLVRLNVLRDQYWVFPCMDSVITRFIKKQDIEGLKEVLNLGVSVVGNNVFHHRLACNFIACDMPSKAASVFQKLGDKLNPRILETRCKYFIKNKKVQHVESLVDMMKSLPISRAVMLKQLIIAYVSVDNMKKASEVLETFETEFIVPHKSTLDFLVASYKKRKMEQPDILKAFLSKRETLDEVKPEDTYSSSSSSSSSESDSETDESFHSDNRLLQEPKGVPPSSEIKTKDS